MASKTLTHPAGDWLINYALYSSKITHNPATGCDEWTGVTNNLGFPFVGAWSISENKHKMVLGHRIALTLKLGRAIRPGMNCNRSCHNRLCMTAEHISEGTQGEKMAKMRSDGVLIATQAGGPRGGYTHKQVNRRYVRSDEEILWIRDAEVADIATRYGYTLRKACRLRYALRHSYKWLPKWEPKPKVKSNKPK